MTKNNKKKGLVSLVLALLVVGMVFTAAIPHKAMADDFFNHPGNGYTDWDEWCDDMDIWFFNENAEAWRDWESQSSPFIAEYYQMMIANYMINCAEW